MMIHVLRQALRDVQTPWLVLPLFEDREISPIAVRDTPLGDMLGRLIGQKELAGSLAELTPLHGVPGTRGRLGAGRRAGARAKFDAGPAFIRPGSPLAKRLAGKATRRRSRSCLPAGVRLPPCRGHLGPRRGHRRRHPRARPAQGRAEPPSVRNASSSSSARKSRTIRPDSARARCGEARSSGRRSTSPATWPTRPRPRRPRPGWPSGSGPWPRRPGSAVQVWDETRIRQERFGGLLGVAAGSASPRRS